MLNDMFVKEGKQTDKLWIIVDPEKEFLLKYVIKSIN